MVCKIKRIDNKGAMLVDAITSFVIITIFIVTILTFKEIIRKNHLQSIEEEYLVQEITNIYTIMDSNPTDFLFYLQELYPNIKISNNVYEITQTYYFDKTITKSISRTYKYEMVVNEVSDGNLKTYYIKMKTYDQYDKEIISQLGLFYEKRINVFL